MKTLVKTLEDAGVLGKRILTFWGKMEPNSAWVMHKKCMNVYKLRLDFHMGSKGLPTVWPWFVHGSVGNWAYETAEKGHKTGALQGLEGKNSCCTKTVYFTVEEVQGYYKLKIRWKIITTKNGRRNGGHIDNSSRAVKLQPLIPPCFVIWALPTRSWLLTTRAWAGSVQNSNPQNPRSGIIQNLKSPCGTSRGHQRCLSREHLGLCWAIWDSYPTCVPLKEKYEGDVPYSYDSYLAVPCNFWETNLVLPYTCCRYLFIK